MTPAPANADVSEEMSLFDDVKEKIKKAVGPDYAHDAIVDGIRAVQASALFTMRNSARSIGSICLLKVKWNNNMLEIMKEQDYNDNIYSIPEGTKGYPPEMKIVLTKVTKEEYQQFRTVFGANQITEQLFRLVTREEFTSHLKRFSANAKWTDVKKKIEMAKVQGLQPNMINTFNTMQAYTKNFVTIMDWMIRTRHLENICFYESNYSLGGTDMICYLKSRTNVDNNYEVVDKTFFDSMHTYSDYATMKNLNGSARFITGNLNLGFARHLAVKKSNDVNSSQKINNAVFIFGLANFATENGSKRLQFINNETNANTPPGVAIIPEPFTVSPQIPSLGLDETQVCTYDKLLKRNLSLKWDSDIFFPTITQIFKEVDVIKTIYVDHMVSESEKSWRKENMHELLECTFYYLREGHFITQDSEVFLPFCDTSIAALHRSLHKIRRYASVSFVEECLWEKTGKDPSGGSMDCRQNMGNDPLTLITDALNDQLRSVKGLKSKNSKPESHVKTAITDLEDAHREWPKRKKEDLIKLRWIKLEIRSVDDPVQGNNCITYPEKDVRPSPAKVFPTQLNLKAIDFPTSKDFYEFMKHCENNVDFKNGVPTHLAFTSNVKGVQKIPIALMLFTGGWLRGNKNLLEECAVKENADGYVFSTPKKPTTNNGVGIAASCGLSAKTLFGSDNDSKKRAANVTESRNKKKTGRKTIGDDVSSSSQEEKDESHSNEDKSDS